MAKEKAVASHGDAWASYCRERINGKTKLSFPQWLLVRTPEFKAWFGDWELFIRSPDTSHAQAKQALKYLSGKDLTNKATGIKAQINANQAGKFLSTEAQAKSFENGFSRKWHYAVTARMGNLWEQAIPFEERKGNRKHDDLYYVRRFAAPVILDGKTCAVTMLVKESSSGRNRIYTIELKEIKTLRAKVMKKADNPEDSLLPRGWSVERILAEIDKKVNPSSISKAIDPETGEPVFPLQVLVKWWKPRDG